MQKGGGQLEVYAGLHLHLVHLVSFQTQLDLQMMEVFMNMKLQYLLEREQQVRLQ